MGLACLRDVSLSLAGRLVLDELSFEIHAGEVFGLLGPNGAGKTTSVRVLCGLLAPDRGRVEVDGIDVAQRPLEARRRLAFVPDGSPLYSNLSPRQILALAGRLHDLDENTIERDSLRMLEAMDLARHVDRPLGEFSHGMRQKVALACALLPKPKLLVLDEPLSGLDVETTAVFKQVLRAWADRGASVLYTSHQLDVVERVCDRMAILAQGRLVALGTLDELRQGSRLAGSLEEVFRHLTQAEDPRERAARILDA